MIIPALVRFYDRLVEEGDEGLAPPGYSRQQITFKVVLNPDGTLHGIDPESVTIVEIKTKRAKGEAKTEEIRRQRPKPVLVCGQTKPTGTALNPCFLWDNSAYLLGFKPEDDKPDRTARAFAAFRDRHVRLSSAIDDPGYRAVCAFLESWKPADAAKHPVLAGVKTGFGVFQIRGEAGYVHERPAVKAWWDTVGSNGGWGGEAPGADSPAKPRGKTKKPATAEPADEDAILAASLTDGRTARIARLHEPRIKNVVGSQSAGATIVSFNQDSFESYGKSQGANAPIAEEDAFKYCTALNRLTGDPSRRVRLAGDTVVFWSEKPAAVGPGLDIAWFAGMALGESPKWDEVSAREAYERALRGETDLDREAAETPFYVLGLSPNISRLHVRLWERSTVGEALARVQQHARDLSMQPDDDQAPPLTLRRIVNETAPPKSGWPDEDAVSPLLYPQLLRAVLTGGPYPAALLVGVLDRVRIEGLADSETRTDWRHAQRRRCAIIRACLTRDARARNIPLEVPVALDETRTDTPYLLGRLFAVLEETQRKGMKVNRTIKDSYFGAACRTPAGVFPRLLTLAQHHLNKIDLSSPRNACDQEIGAVMNAIQNFPAVLPIAEQGMFTIGYYHQRQKYFASKPGAPATAAD